MKTDRDRLFTELEPPPGGAARMRAKLKAHKRHSVAFRLRYAAAGIAVVGALALITVLRTPPSGSAPTQVTQTSPAALAESSPWHTLLARHSEPFELSVLRNGEPVTVVELNGSSNVRFYELQ